MKRFFRRSFPQPLLAVALDVLAVLCFVTALQAMPIGMEAWVNVPTLTLALILAVSVVVADLRPIHVTYHTKVALTTVPLYLMAVLLPLPLVAVTAGASRLVGEVLERKRRGTLPADIASATGRAVIVGLLGAAVSHIPFVPDDSHIIALFVTAAAM